MRYSVPEKVFGNSATLWGRLAKLGAPNSIGVYG